MKSACVGVVLIIEM